MQSKRMTKRPYLISLLVLLLAATLLATANAAGNSITTPDTAGNVGEHTSLVLDADGNPVVSYYDQTNGDLKILHCNDPNCAGDDESITSPDTEGLVGLFTALALDGDGNPVVSYWDATKNDLKILHCNDPNCDGGGESITSPDTEGLVGAYSSLALDQDGNPVVSYYDRTKGDLKILHCSDPNCADGDERITSPDTEGDVGLFTSLALDENGNPVVSYHDATKEILKILRCDDPNCDGDGESITSPDPSDFVGMYSSLALDGDGNPVVSYYDYINQDLKILHCTDPACAGDVSITSPDTAGIVGQYTSLVLDADGNPVVSYYELTNFDLKVMHCNDPNCAGGDETITGPDTDGNVGMYSSLALDEFGNPVVSYRHVGAGKLKLLHCGSPICADENTAPTIHSVSNDGPVIVTESATITVDAGDPAGTGDPLSYWFDCDGDDSFEVGPQPESSALCHFPIAGARTVNVLVTDGDGGEATDSTVVTVLSAQEAIALLQADVQALMDDGVLSAVEGGRLLALLNDAVKGLDRGQGQTAVARLDAFVQRVVALLDRDVLAPDEGQPLIDLAQRIIAAI